MIRRYKIQQLFCVGAGSSSSSGASGASYGGRGGQGSAQQATMPYGSIYTVETWGSGGGGSGSYRGGRGGGALQIHVTDDMTFTGSMDCSAGHADVSQVNFQMQCIAIITIK